MLYNRSNALGASIILLPLCYFMLARGLKKYWIDNPLRQEYKAILQPQHLRYTDKCSDYRPLDEMLDEMRAKTDSASKPQQPRGNLNFGVTRIRLVS